MTDNVVFVYSLRDSNTTKRLGTNVFNHLLLFRRRFKKTVQEDGSKIWQVTLLIALTSTGKKNFIRKCVEDNVIIYLHKRHQLLSHCREKTAKIQTRSARRPWSKGNGERTFFENLVHRVRTDVLKYKNLHNFAFCDHR